MQKKKKNNMLGAEDSTKGIKKTIVTAWLEYRQLRRGIIDFSSRWIPTGSRPAVVSSGGLQNVGSRSENGDYIYAGERKPEENT